MIGFIKLSRKQRLMYPPSYTQNEKLKEYRGALHGSRENFSEKLDQLEHRLLTADITK